MIEYVSKFSLKAVCDRCGCMAESVTKIRTDDPGEGSDYILETLPKAGWYISPHEDKNRINCICPNCRGKA
jgi:hypothetical protein